MLIDSWFLPAQSELQLRLFSLCKWMSEQLNKHLQTLNMFVPRVPDQRRTNICDKPRGTVKGGCFFSGQRHRWKRVSKCFCWGRCEAADNMQELFVCSRLTAAQWTAIWNIIQHNADEHRGLQKQTAGQINKSFYKIQLNYTRDLFLTYKWFNSYETAIHLKYI